MHLFETIDLSDARHVYVVGDIHGMWTALEDKLASFGFDPLAGDHLLSVGDLVDRGPECLRTWDFIDLPWFHRVLGNHEHMLSSPVQQEDWWESAPHDQRSGMLDRLMDAPVILEVILRDKVVGIAHANIPPLPWGEIKDIPEHMHYRWMQYCMWDREGIRNDAHPVEGVDEVYFGHSPISDPIVRANRRWIDTGAVYGGRFTIGKVQ